jgi:hypothetical protein
MLSHIGWVDVFLGTDQPWPVKSQQVQRRVTAHHKKLSHAKPSNSFLYEPRHIKTIAHAIGKLTEPSQALHRIMLRLELVKFFGLLRTDDARWIHPASVQLEHGERALIGSCTKSKGSERTAGRLLNGMPFRVPLVASLHATGWWHGYLNDLAIVGIVPNDDHSVPMNDRSIKWGVRPGVANIPAYMRHLRAALSECGLAKEAKFVSAHSAKRSGMAEVNRYTGPAELTDGQKSDILHHRATGKRKCAGAYDPHLLVGPVKKARLIWDEWLTSDKAPFEGPSLPTDRYLYAKIGREKSGFEGTYCHHVVVEADRTGKSGIRQTLKHKSRNCPMRISYNGIEWEALCDRVPFNANRSPLVWSNGATIGKRCKECQSRAGRYLAGFKNSQPCAVPQ